MYQQNTSEAYANIQNVSGGGSHFVLLPREHHRLSHGGTREAYRDREQNARCQSPPKVMNQHRKNDVRIYSSMFLQACLPPKRSPDVQLQTTPTLTNNPSSRLYGRQSLVAPFSEVVIQMPTHCQKC